MGQYYEVSHNDILSPVDEGLYEYRSNSYEPSTDTSVNTSKTYYEYDDYDSEDDPEEEPVYEAYDIEADDSPVDLELYELVDGNYVLTEDEEPSGGKTYYEVFYPYYTDEFLDETEQYYPFDEEEDELTNPVAQGLYEYVDGMYILSEDTVPDEEKVYYVDSDSEYEYVDDLEIEDDTAEMSLDDIIDENDFPTFEETDSYTTEGNFVYAFTEYITDPSAEGFYEIQNGAYVLTTDTEVIRRKIYYKQYIYSDYYVADMTGVEDPSASLIYYYELVNGSYALTEDTEVDAQKTYYRSRQDDKYPFVPDPTVNFDPMEDDEVPYGEGDEPEDDEEP